jgi:hypothetical protein
MDFWPMRDSVQEISLQRRAIRIEYGYDKAAQQVENLQG